MKGFWIGNPGINSDWYYNANEYAFLTFMYNHGKYMSRPLYVETDIHTHINTYIYTYIHTYMHTFSSEALISDRPQRPQARIDHRK